MLQNHDLASHRLVNNWTCFCQSNVDCAHYNASLELLVMGSSTVHSDKGPGLPTSEHTAVWCVTLTIQSRSTIDRSAFCNSTFCHRLDRRISQALAAISWSESERAPTSRVALWPLFPRPFSIPLLKNG